MQNIWLFQANPDDYDLTEEIRNGTKDDWELNQHRKDVSEGETVILWQSGNGAGIYGFGRLADMKGEDRINIEYTERLDAPVSKDDLLDDPVLCNLLVIKMPFGKNPFKVKADEWNALATLLGKRS